MSGESDNSAAAKFVLLILGLTALAIIATMGIAYVISSPPRGFMFWVGTGFVCVVEFLVGTLTVNIFARSRCQYRPSGAILAIIFSIVGAYALSGLLSILVYWAVRVPDGSRDGAFTGVLAGITVFWFIIAALLYRYDLYRQGKVRPAMEKRAEHGRRARSLKNTLSLIRAVRTNDDGLRTRLSILTKKLESIETELAHSHGGGVGSWEAGKNAPSSPADDEELAGYIDKVGEVAARLSAGKPEEARGTISELESYATRLGSVVDTLELA